MFYKHWKKLSLALTSFFWVSCDNNSTAVEPPSNGEPPHYSSSSETPESSAAESSSSESNSSSSFEQVMPAYGVVAACYEDENEAQLNFGTGKKKLYCDDGVTCTETQRISSGREYPCTTIDEGDFKEVVVCPDYGVVTITEKIYDCNGIKFNEAEFHSRYFNAGIKPSSSSSTEQSSSSQVSCTLPEGYFCKNRTEKYTERQAISDATSKVRREGFKKIDEIIREQFKDKDVPECLQDMNDTLEREFAPVYGAMMCTTPSRFRCSDGTTYTTPEYLEQLAFDAEQEKKKPQYEEKYAEVYKEETEKFDKEINDCLNSEKTEE